MKADNRYEVTGHNRTILVTEIDGAPLGELSVTVGYTGQGDASKGVTLDGFVIPAIMKGINGPLLASEMKFQRLLTRLNDILDAPGAGDVHAALEEAIAEAKERDGGGETKASRPSTEADRAKLVEIDKLLRELPTACVAAVAKSALFVLSEDGRIDAERATLVDLDALTDEDPAL